ncbi:hypothetical protein O7632_21585 [Solwaraspora sp. WMMD406]|uniref:hypothetical protein n=1 Tax=Solwaraspora sp. WMMD406 TaxID=3016095 RepID=UPI002417ACCF|nr:hypothetical protein [Solwaraspora sp. WMMD406]MDG4766668.1 hypothetical protein [Solwaraspora sp. WMMD406]
MRRSLLPRTLAGTAAGVAALLVLTGCAVGGPRADESLTAEAHAMRLLGFADDDIADVADPADVASLTIVESDHPDDGRPGWWQDRPGRYAEGGGPWRGRHPLRGAGLHGEVTVETEDGPRTIVAQRGTVEAVDGTTVTVESADGYLLDWTCADGCRVIDQGDRIGLAELDLDTAVGVAGVRDGEDLVARLVLRPKAK